MGRFQFIMPFSAYLSRAPVLGPVRCDVDPLGSARGPRNCAPGQMLTGHYDSDVQLITLYRERNWSPIGAGGTEGGGQSVSRDPLRIASGMPKNFVNYGICLEPRFINIGRDRERERERERRLCEGGIT
jgi:hypothetical protein